MISRETRELIGRLLLKKIPLAGISMAVNVSERWFRNYVNGKYENVPNEVTAGVREKGSLTVEYDEMWSSVGNKDYKMWIWLAMVFYPSS